MFGLELLDGRNVQPSDTIREFILNETAVRKLGAGTNQDVIGQTAAINGRKGTIVGIVKDFHNKSFRQAIDPLYISTLRDNYNTCAVKINMASMGSTLTSLEKVWTQVYPDNYYKYDFLDDRIARLYKQDHVVLQAIEAFAVIAIIIVSLGLYGMVSFMATEKTKEVGVRKVLGASISGIVWLFGQEFTRLLILAFVITAPLAWLVMNHWLGGFAYRIEIGVGTFISAILISLVITLLTVGYMSLKTALMNPVKSLRSE
jgi:ABC-type antimicrobial peptide transport system permease subunit